LVLGQDLLEALYQQAPVSQEVDSLLPGTLFTHESEQYMKINPVGYHYVDALVYKAVNVRTGHAAKIPKDTVVIVNPNKET